MLGLRSQALREDANLLHNVSYPSKTSVRVGIPENGFMNPKSQGRAIYDMTCTPDLNVNPSQKVYSGQHVTTYKILWFVGLKLDYTLLNSQGSSSVYDGYGGPSASPSSVYAWEHDAQRGSKQLVHVQEIIKLPIFFPRIVFNI